MWHLHFFLAVHSKPSFKGQTLPSLVYMHLVDFTSSTFFCIKANQSLLKGLSASSWKERWANEIFWVWGALEGEDLLGHGGGLKGAPFTSQWRETQQLILGIIRIGCVCRMFKQNRPIVIEQVAGAAVGALSHQTLKAHSSQDREDRGFRVDEGPSLPQTVPPQAPDLGFHAALDVSVENIGPGGGEGGESGKPISMS